MSDVTQILARIDSGDPAAASQLLPLVYDELRKLAAARLAHEKPGQTLQATALVHEAYLRLVGSEGPVEPELRVDSGFAAPDGSRRAGGTYSSRGHFFAAAATAMRRILIENARRKNRHKHGGLLLRVELADLPEQEDPAQLLALDEALNQLAFEDPGAAQVVELHHFAGLSHDSVAQTLGLTVYEARQKWAYARAWLLNALADK